MERTRLLSSPVPSLPDSIASDIKAASADKLSEVEGNIAVLRDKFASQCRKHRPHGDTVERPPDAFKHLYVPRFHEMLADTQKMREERAAIVQQFADLPRWPPPVELLAERVRMETVEAAVLTNDLPAMRQRLHAFFLRRRDALRQQRRMVFDRLHSFVPGWAQLNQLAHRLREYLEELQGDLEATETRMKRLQPEWTSTGAPVNHPVVKASTGDDLFFSNTMYRDSSLCCIFRADVVVCIRDFVVEERATRFLRRFLTNMRHLPEVARWEIWRRTLRYHTSIKTEEGDSSGLPPTSLARKDVESLARQHAEMFCIQESLQADDGHHFSYVVTTEFPRIFARQGEIISSNGRSAPLSGQQLSNARRLLKIASAWVPYVLMTARLDLTALEQRALLLQKAEGSTGANRMGRKISKNKTSGLAAARTVTRTASKQNIKPPGVRSTESQAQQDMVDLLDGELKVELSLLSHSDAHGVQQKFQARATAQCTTSAVPRHLVLAQLYLQYLRSRELRWQLLNLLNLFRHVQHKVARAELQSQLEDLPDAQTGLSSGRPPASQLEGCPGSVPPSLPAPHWVHSRGPLPMDFAEGLQYFNQADRLLKVKDEIVVCNEQGVEVLHAISTEDLAALEREMLLVGTYFTREAEAKGKSVDRGGVLLKLLAAEVAFHRAKLHLLLPYLVIVEHAADPAGRHAVCQRIVDLMAARPCLDLEAQSFEQAYAAACESMQERARVMTMVLVHQIAAEKHVTSQVHQHVGKKAEEPGPSTAGVKDPQLALDCSLSRPEEGYPLRGDSGLCLDFVPALDASGEFSKCDLLEFLPSASLVWHVDVVVEETCQQLQEFLAPEVKYKGALERACAAAVSSEWQKALQVDPTRLLAPGAGSGDFLNCEAADDPEWLCMVLEDSMQRMPSIFANAGKEALPADDASAPIRRNRQEAAGGLAHEGHDGARDQTSSLATTGGGGSGRRSSRMWQGSRGRRTSTMLELPRDRAASSHEETGQAAAPTVDMHVKKAFEDLRMKPCDERILCMYLNMLEHITVRSQLMDTMGEVKHLGSCLTAQADIAGLELQLRSEVLQDLTSLSSYTDTKAGPEIANQYCLSSDLDPELGVDLSTSQAVTLYCSTVRLQEMRVAMQHELVNKWLYVADIMHNNLLLDEKMIKLALREVEADSGPSPGRGTRQLSPNDASWKAERTRQTKQAVAFQFPSGTRATMRTGLTGAFRESAGLVRERLDTLVDPHDRTIQVRRYKFWLLSSGSLSLMEHVCDMLVRIQAAGMAAKFQRLVSMVPRALSPFQFSSPDILKPMVDAEGRVRSVFNVPRPLDLLALRGTAAVAVFEVAASSLRTAAQVDTVLGKSAKETLVLPQMEVCYTGPCYVTLCLLHHMAPLVSSFFFWTSLAAEKWMPLHLHQAVLGVRWQDATQMDAVASVLSEEMLGEVDMDEVDLEHRKGGVHKAWDALQVMRVEFSSLAAQLRGLTDNSPDTIIGFLKAKLQSAAWRTSLLLQQASRDALQQERLHDFAEVQTWSKYLDGHPLNRSASAVSLVVGLAQDSDELLQGLANQTLERKLGTEAHSAGLRSVQSPLNHRPLSDYEGWLAPLSRPCRYLNAFLHVLLAIYQSGLPPSSGPRPSSFNKSVEKDSMRGSFTTLHAMPPPQKLAALLPGRLPALPLEALPRALCLLPATSREQVASFALQLEMKVEDWRVFTGTPDQDTSLSAETELVRGKLVAMRLNEAATCAQLGVFPPRTSQELQAMEQVTEGYVPASLRIELADDHGARMSGPLSDTEEAEEQRLRGIGISQELRAEISLVALLEVELAKVLATFAASAFEKQLAEIEEFRSPGSLGSTAGPAGIRGTYSHPTSHTRKLEAVVALNRLRTRGTRCRTHGLGEPNLYVIRERDVDDCVEELGRQLLQWLFVSTDSQLWSMSTAVASTASEVKRLEQGALQDTLEARLRSDRFGAEVASHVALRSGMELFEVDRLNRVLCEMTATGLEMEHRLNAHVRATLLAEMEGLEQQGNAAEGRFKEYIAEMRDLVHRETIPSAEVKAFQEELQSDIRQRLKDDASAAQAAASVASPGPGQSAVAKEVEQNVPLKAPVTVVSSATVSAPEEEFAHLHAEMAALRKAEVRLQTLYKLQHQRLRSEQEQQIKQLTVFLSSNAGLWEHVSEVREREHLTKEQLASSERRKEQAHTTIYMHSQHRALEEETNERLESWKGAAFECHRGLLAESQKYETQSSLDKESLEHELAKVDQEIQQFNRGNTLKIRVTLEKERYRKEQQHHRQRAKTEERLAKKAVAQADVLRRELDCGDADAESLIGLCVEEYRETLQKVLSLEAENAAMKAAVAEEAESKGRRHAIQGHHLVRKGVDAAKQKALAQATDLEDVCFSMGGTHTSLLPKFRSKIDQTHGGRVDVASLAAKPAFNFNGGPPPGLGSRSARSTRDASPLASLAATARQLSARGSPPGTSGASRPPGTSGTSRLEVPPGSAGAMSRREMQAAIASELLNLQPSASGTSGARG